MICCGNKIIDFGNKILYSGNNVNFFLAWPPYIFVNISE